MCWNRCRLWSRCFFCWTRFRRRNCVGFRVRGFCWSIARSFLINVTVRRRSAATIFQTLVKVLSLWPLNSTKSCGKIIVSKFSVVGNGCVASLRCSACCSCSIVVMVSMISCLRVVVRLQWLIMCSSYSIGVWLWLLQKRHVRKCSGVLGIRPFVETKFIPPRAHLWITFVFGMLNCCCCQRRFSRCETKSWMSTNVCFGEWLPRLWRFLLVVIVVWVESFCVVCKLQCIPERVVGLGTICATIRYLTFFPRNPQTNRRCVVATVVQERTNTLVRFHRLNVWAWTRKRKLRTMNQIVTLEIVTNVNWFLSLVVVLYPQSRWNIDTRFCRRTHCHLHQAIPVQTVHNFSLCWCTEVGAHVRPHLCISNRCRQTLWVGLRWLTSSCLAMNWGGGPNCRKQPNCPHIFHHIWIPLCHVAVFAVDGPKWVVDVVGGIEVPTKITWRHAWHCQRKSDPDCHENAKWTQRHHTSTMHLQYQQMCDCHENSNCNDTHPTTMAATFMNCRPAVRCSCVSGFETHTQRNCKCFGYLQQKVLRLCCQCKPEIAPTYIETLERPGKPPFL